MIRRWPLAGIGFGLLWVFVRGPEPAIDAFVGQFLLGLVVGFPVAYLFRRLYSEGIDLSGTLRSVPPAALYGLAFLREVVVANVDVARRVLAPDMPIEPEVILIPLRVQTDLGVTTIANSITITPGTITLDHDPEENALFVHVIDGRDPEAIVEPIRTWEDYALEIFDEELSPGDPAPEFSVYPPEMEVPPASATASEGIEEIARQRDDNWDDRGGDDDGR